MADTSSSDTTSENITKLMTALIRDRYCGTAFYNYDACAQNFMFTPESGGYIEESLLRRAKKRCDPYMSAYSKCLSNEKYQNALLRSAVKVPACRQARGKLEKCQRTSKVGCERESEELVFCGLSYMIMSEAKT